jgi:hypothetical protein
MPLRNRILLLVLLCCISLPALLTGQVQRRPGEVRLRLPRVSYQYLNQIGQYYTVDHGSTPQALVVYASERAIAQLLRARLPFEIIPAETTDLQTIDAATWSTHPKTETCSVPPNAYPSYELYETLLQDFALARPDLCRLVDFGTTSQGRRLLALKITDQPDTDEPEPRFFYTSTMHGDELAGFPILLRLIDYLLCNYDSDKRVRELVDNIEIWINPLANPDGTYLGGNHSVAQSIRYNAQGVDLNRNFPDPDDGPHPDGQPYQPETLAFMALADSVGFDLSCNIHGGAEVVNYPFDTYAELPADIDWWHHVSRQFADTAQYYSPTPGYLTDLNNGTTNGFAWYEVRGGRQDYMNYEQRAREMTLEISGQKKLASARLNELWEATHRSLLNYLAQARNGLQGTIRDSLTGEPIAAEVYLPDHDFFNSRVYAKLPTGRYHRYLKAGSYTVMFSAPGYEPKTMEVAITDDEPTRLDVLLSPPTDVLAVRSFDPGEIQIYYAEGGLRLDTDRFLPDTKVQVYDLAGHRLYQTTVDLVRGTTFLPLSQQAPGIVVLDLFQGQRRLSQKILIRKKK